MSRHDRMRDWLAARITQVMGRTALTEQLVLKWGRPNKEEEIIRARFDVAYNDAQGRRMYIDVEVTDAATLDAHELRTRAVRDGAAAAREEDRKRLRYPGPDLVPFVIEAMGRPGDSADALLRSLAPRDLTERSRVLGAARQSLSVLLQMGNAELILSSQP